MAKPTRLDDCQYLLRSPLNYTLTHFADHSDRFTHDMLNRYLRGDRVSPRVITGIGAPIKRSTSLRNAESLIFSDIRLLTFGRAQGHRSYEGDRSGITRYTAL